MVYDVVEESAESRAHEFGRRVGHLLHHTLQIQFGRNHPACAVDRLDNLRILAEPFLSPLALGDVVCAAGVALELAALDARHTDRPHPPVFAVAPAEAELGPEAAAAGSGFEISADISFAVLRMNELRPAVAAHIRLAGAEELQVLAVDELATVRAVDPHQHGRAVGERAEALFAIA